MLVSAISRASHSTESHFMTSPKIPRMLLPVLGPERLLGPKSAPCLVSRSAIKLAFIQRMTQILTTSADRPTIIRFSRPTTDYCEYREPSHDSGDYVKWRYNTHIKRLKGRCIFLFNTCSNQRRACLFGSIALTYLKTMPSSLMIQEYYPSLIRCKC